MPSSRFVNAGHRALWTVCISLVCATKPGRARGGIMVGKPAPNRPDVAFSVVVTIMTCRLGVALNVLFNR